MSSEYFGLIMDPFESGPDPRFLYMDAARRNVFAQLLSAVYECKGLVLLACRRGLGKSTLVRHLSDQLAALDSVLMLYPGGVLSCRPGMTFADVLAACRGRLDRRNKNASDEGRLPATLEQAVGHGQAVVLILDDADALDDAALARLGGLCDADVDDRRPMSVILVGTAELSGRLERLTDRAGRTVPADLALDLAPLRDRDIDRMVRHRLMVAGLSDGDLFSPVALAEVARRSRGEPLRIVALCAGALALAEQERKPTVSRELVERAADRFGDPDEAPLAPAVAEATSSRIRLRDVGVPDEPRRLRVAETNTDAETGAEAGAEADTRAWAEARGRRPVRRLDDVAEAIRAADRRSTGDADPHIRFTPAPSRPVAEREPHASAEEHTLTPEPRGMADQAYALYPGVRPSETRPARRRSGIGAVLTIGLLLALLAAGGAYAVRAGLVDVGSIPNALQAAVDRVVHMVGSLIKSDPSTDESVAGISPGTPGGTAGGLAGGTAGGAAGGAGSADLGFGRFGSAPAPGRDDVRPAEHYDFAPPPPQSGREPGAAEAPGGGSQPGESEAAPPAAAAAPSQPGASPAERHAAPAPPPSGGAPAATAEAGADAGSALSFLRPPEMKPSPPQPQPQLQPQPQASPAAASRQVPPRGEEPAPPRPDAGRAQPHEPLLARGDEYLGSGDLDMARTFYQMAFERGSAEAAIRMGWTFDPQYFQRIGLRSEASPREAILWYQEALRRGSSQASGRLSDLATWLQSAAASGDLEAQRILRMWQG